MPLVLEDPLNSLRISTKFSNDLLKKLFDLLEKTMRMKNIILAILLFCVASCNTKENKVEPKVTFLDNIELIEIYENDQADRQIDAIDWSIVSKNDSLREVRIYQLLDSNYVRTSKDYHNAAMIFQHGGDSTAYGMAVKLMRKSIELDTTVNKWLLAAATDRYLLSKNESQIYGTQYQRFSPDEPWVLGKMDTTKISDSERIEYGVETLAQQREKVKKMNQKKLSNLVNNRKTIDEIIELIISNINLDSEFDLSESGINAYGYHLIRNGKTKQALKIFKLNTELFPNSYNTHDSYGECLLLQGNIEEGIIAYKKSLEMNPENKIAEAIIAENK
ncbi:MAG: tetratricopeptide repeat protein [Flavobacteriaceae bacterium]|nr:MAG: tetratricopeptide repeat protein [Flavobacteriaceae bacterium]